MSNDAELAMIIKVIDEYSAEFKKAQDEIKKVGKELDDGSEKSKSFSSKLMKTADSVVLAWSAVGATLVKALKQASQAYFENERASMGMELALRSSGLATSNNVKYFDALSKEVEKNTGYSNDQVKMTIALAANYGLASNQIAEYIPKLADVATYSYLVTGQQRDMQDVLKAVRMAGEGSSRALTSLGIVLTDEQQQLIKTSSEGERLAIVMDLVSKKTGEMGGIMNKTAQGDIKRLRNAWNELMSTMGKGITNLVKGPIGKSIAWLVEMFTQGFQEIAITVSAAMAAIYELGDSVIHGRFSWESYKQSLSSINAEMKVAINEVIGGKTALDELDNSVGLTTNSFESLKEKTSEYLQFVTDLDAQLAIGMITESQYNIALQQKQASYDGLFPKIQQYIGYQNSATTSVNNFSNSIFSSIEANDEYIENLVAGGLKQSEIAAIIKQEKQDEEDQKKTFAENELQRMKDRTKAETEYIDSFIENVNRCSSAQDTFLTYLDTVNGVSQTNTDNEVTFGLKKADSDTGLLKTKTLNQNLSQERTDKHVKTLSSTWTTFQTSLEKSTTEHIANLTTFWSAFQIYFDGVWDEFKTRIETDMNLAKIAIDKTKEAVIQLIEKLNIQIGLLSKIKALNKPNNYGSGGGSATDKIEGGSNKDYINRGTDKYGKPINVKDFLITPRGDVLKISPRDTIVGFEPSSKAFGDKGNSYNIKIDNVYGVNADDISDALQKKLSNMIGI